VVALDRREALAVGKLSAPSGASDIVGVSVVVCARERHSIIPNNPDDLHAIDPAVVLRRPDRLVTKECRDRVGVQRGRIMPAQSPDSEVAPHRRSGEGYLGLTPAHREIEQTGACSAMGRVP
jgi:hypothetical protein